MGNRNKNLFVSFLKDRAMVLSAYVLNAVFIILFFNLLHQDTIEILYPAAISGFLFAIVLLIEWTRYYPFNSSLSDDATQNAYISNPITWEQKNLYKWWNEMNQAYRTEIDKLNSDHEDKLHFISQWVHNLKTSISVVELIVQKYDSQENIPKEALKTIDEENSRLNCSVDQILSILRLNNFEKDCEIVAFDLLTALRDVINDKKNQFIYGRVLPVMEFIETDVFVVSDIKWNKLMLDQIISNAIKYSSNPDEDKKVYFQIRKGDVYTTLIVRDEGMGIPDYDLKRVFEPFFTGENGRRYRNSTGIGLFICKKITQLLGQEIHIKSELSKGTEVRITYLTKV